MLCVKAELENVASISLPKGHSYCITVRRQPIVHTLQRYIF